MRRGGGERGRWGGAVVVVVVGGVVWGVFGDNGKVARGHGDLVAGGLLVGVKREGRRRGTNWSAVFWLSPGSLSKSLKRVSSVWWSRWWILLRRDKRLATAAGGGLLVMADEITLTM